MKITEISSIGNYHGCLNVTKSKGKYYWIIENWGSSLDNIRYWEEIPKSLYDEIIKHNKSLES